MCVQVFREMHTMARAHDAGEGEVVADSALPDGI